jgi:hypothetical protein
VIAALLLSALAAAASALDPQSAQRLETLRGQNSMPNATLADFPDTPEIMGSWEQDGTFWLLVKSERKTAPVREGEANITRVEYRRRTFVAAPDGSLRRVKFEDSMSWASEQEALPGPSADRVAARLLDETMAAMQLNSVEDVLERAKGSEGVWSFSPKGGRSVGVMPVAASGDPAMVQRYGNAFVVSVGDSRNDRAGVESQLTQESTSCVISSEGRALSASYKLAKHYSITSRDGAPAPEDARYFDALLAAYLRAALP